MIRPRLLEPGCKDTLPPTFVPASAEDPDATIGASDLYSHWARPDAQTVKPSGISARSGYSDESSRSQPLVNTSILHQLCNLLKEPETPPGDVQRVLQGPLRRDRLPRVEQAEARETMPMKPSAKSRHRDPAPSASSASETVPRAHQAANVAFETQPAFPKPQRPQRQEQPEKPEQRRKLERGPSEFVDPSLVAQLCHLLTAPDTPSSAAAASETRKPRPQAESLGSPDSPASPALPAEETLQRPQRRGWEEESPVQTQAMWADWPRESPGRDRYPARAPPARSGNLDHLGKSDPLSSYKQLLDSPFCRPCSYHFLKFFMS